MSTGDLLSRDKSGSDFLYIVGVIALLCCLSFLCGGFIEFSFNSLIGWFVGLLGGVFLLYKYIRSRVTITWGQLMFLPWLIWGLISYLFLSNATWHASLLLSSYLSAYLLFLFAGSLKDIDRVRLLMGVELLTIVIVIFTIIQKVQGPTWHPFLGDGFVSRQYGDRLGSVFAMPNSLACFLLMVLPIFLLKVFTVEKSIFYRCGYGLLSVILLWALISTESRAALLIGGGLVGVSCFLSSGLGKVRLARLVLWGGIYGGMNYVMLTVLKHSQRFGDLVETGGEVTRKVYFAAAGAMVCDSPMVGQGLGNFQLVWDTLLPIKVNHDETYLHSDYLEVLSELGVVGFTLLFVPIIFLVIRAGGALVNSITDSPNELKVSFIGLLGLGCHLLVNFESKLLVTLFLASFYFAIIVRHTAAKSSGRFGRPLNKWGGIFVVGCLLVGGVSLLPNLYAAAKFSDAQMKYRYISMAQAQGKVAPPGLLAATEHDFAQARRWNSNHMLAYWYAGRAHVSHMFYEGADLRSVADRAVEYYDEALELAPYKWQLWAERGEVLSYIPEKRGAARASYLMAIDIAPLSQAAKYNYLMFLASHGDSSDEVEFLTMLNVLKEADPTGRTFPRVLTLREAFFKSIKSKEGNSLESM